MNNMKKIGLKGVVKFFSDDFSTIDNNAFLDTHKYLMKRAEYKIMLGLIKVACAVNIKLFFDGLILLIK